MTFHFELDTIMVVVIMNVLLTALHYALFRLYQAKKWKWSNTALMVIDFILNMISIIIANRAHPPDRSEVEPPPK